MSVLRVQGWEDVLRLSLRTAEQRTFDWGTFDCALFACDVICDLTGFDPGVSFRERYSTSRGALRVLRTYLKKSTERPLLEVADAVCQEYNWPRYDTVKRAKRGDLLFHNDPDLLEDDRGMGSLGICEGPTGAFITESGLSHVPLKRCEVAWALGWPAGT